MNTTWYYKRNGYSAVMLLTPGAEECVEVYTYCRPDGSDDVERDAYTSQYDWETLDAALTDDGWTQCAGWPEPVRPAGQRNGW